MRGMALAMVGGLLSYAVVASALWLVLPALLAEAGTESSLWLALMLWVPPLLAGGYAAARLAGRRTVLPGLLVGALGTLATLAFIKLKGTFALVLGLMVVGGLIAAAAGRMARRG